MVLEKKQEDRLNQSCEKWSQRGRERPTWANWIGHIPRRNCLLIHVTEWNVEGTKDEEEDVRNHWITLRKIGNGKAIPLQAWTGREGSRRLRLPDFKTIGT